MKFKKITALLMTALLISVCLSSCSKQSNVFFPDFVRYSLTRFDSDSSFSFNMNALCDKSNPKISIIGIEGENVEDTVISFSDDTPEDLKNKKIDSKYFRMIGVKVEFKNPYTRIDSINVSVDSKKQKIVFPVSIENRYQNIDSIPHALVQRNTPTYIFSSTLVGGGNQEYTFTFNCVEDVTVKSIGFNDFFIPDKTTYSVNEKKVTLPVDLKTGDVFGVSTQIKPIADYDESLWMNYYCDFIVESEGGGVKYTDMFPLSCIAVGNYDDAKNFVKFYDTLKTSEVLTESAK